MRRKRPRSSKVLFFLSLVVAVGATLVLRGHLLRLEAGVAATGPGEPVVVAATDIARGSVLTEEALSVRSIPGAFRPPGAIDRVDRAVGRMLAADLLRGEAVTVSRLAGEGGPVASIVPAGLRAVQVSVAAPPGLLASGDRVDVLATYGAGQPRTETVVSAAEVLTILDGATDGFEVAPTLVLLVSPDVAERLAYARAFADLSIAVTSAEEPA